MFFATKKDKVFEKGNVIAATTADITVIVKIRTI
jgi:hypothetical protein